MSTIVLLLGSQASAGTETAVVGAGFESATIERSVDPGPTGGAETFDPNAPLWEPGVLDPSAGLLGRWQRELERRQAILRQHDGRSHTAALALLGLATVLAGEVDRAVLIELVDEVRNDRRRHPLVRSLATDVRGQLHEDAGEPEQARQLYADNGRLMSWRIAGPFDNANRGGHQQAYPPESEAWAVDQAFEGKLAGEPITWRAYEPENTLGVGYVSFDEFLRPNEYVTGYATTWVRVPKAMDAVMHLGTGGAHKLWVGEQLVGEGQTYRRPDPLQEAYAIHLEQGWNRILIKVGCEQGAWGFFARISATDGSPIAGLEVSGAPAVEVSELPVAPPGKASAEIDPDAKPAAAPQSLRKLFEDAADEAVTKKPTPEAELALAEFYSWTAPFAREDFTARDQAREADAAMQSPRSAMFLALAEDDSARARKAFEVGVTRAEQVGVAARAEHSQMLMELAYANASLGLDRRAEALLEQARQVAPDDALIELAAVEQLANDGFELAALSWLEDLRRRYPSSATILRDEASRQLSFGRIREGLALLEQYSKEHSGDTSVMDQRIDAHLRLGEVDAAVTLARQSATSAGGRPSAWRRLAAIEEAAGDYQRAIAALEEAVALAPQDPDLHTALGLLQSRAGDQAASVLAFQRSLELNPQQPELRDLLTTLGAASDDVFSRYAVDLEQVVAEVEKEKSPPSWIGKDSAVLHHTIATRISASGLGERLDHRIIRILDDRGIESQAVHSFGYDPSESYVEVRRARVRRADGRIEDIGIVDVFSIGNAGYRMYYDQRAISVQFPGLRVGDTIEVAFVRRDVAARNKFDEYYGDLIPLQSIEPIRKLEYVLEAPADVELHFNQPVTSETSKDGKTKIHRLVRDNLIGMWTEGAMPGLTEIADYLHVSTYATWDDVGRWYWGLVKGQLLVDDQIKAGVEKALSELPKDATERDKIAALYRHVIKSTRYVGLEFGIHGYKPYRTTDIYNRRFGDCKDKASLLKVMLAEIGVDSHLVLVRTRDLGTIGDKPASLSVFNHAIVYVPKYDLYMDGTAEHSGAFELPSGDQGASVLIVKDGDGAEFRTIPFDAPSANQTSYTQVVSLAADGNAKVEHEMIMAGVGASAWRATLEPEGQRTELLTKQLAGTFPGTVVANAEFPGITDVLAPVHVKAELSVPGWGQVQGSGLRFRLLGHDVQLVRGLAPQTKREHPLVLGVPNREVRNIEYELPRGLKFSQVPKPARIDSPFGSFELKVDAKDRTAVITTSIEFARSRIEPGEYQAFREFLREVDAALAQAFEAQPER